MLVVFANNQVLIAAAGTTVTITTDPVAVGGNNRATAVTNVHGIFNPSATGLEWKMQISMDGQTWVDQGPALASAVAVGETMEGPGNVTGVYARLEIKFGATGGIGAVTFDVHANFDRS